MDRNARMALLCLGLVACGGEGDWVVQTWGEEYIEQQIPADAFEDGCSARFDTFLVTMAARELLDGDGEVVGALTPAEIYDLTVEGPTSMGTVAVPADHYSEVVVRIAPDASAVAATASPEAADALTAAGASVLVDGTLTCGGADKHFRWTFAESTTYRCAPADLTIPAGGSDTTEVTVHGDHLFYDGLENADAAVRGQALFDADADADGEIALEELQAVSIPTLGYEVGQYSDVLDLRQFVSHLTRTLVHIDGEGECLVDL